MDISTEVTVMTLAGYNEWDYPNDKRFLEQRNLIKYLDTIINELRSNHSEVVKEFVKVRKKGLSLVKDVKYEIVKILHMQKLPRKCKLY